MSRSSVAANDVFQDRARVMTLDLQECRAAARFPLLYSVSESSMNKRANSI